MFSDCAAGVAAGPVAAPQPAPGGPGHGHPTGGRAGRVDWTASRNPSGQSDTFCTLLDGEISVVPIRFEAWCQLCVPLRHKRYRYRYSFNRHQILLINVNVSLFFEMLLKKHFCCFYRQCCSMCCTGCRTPSWPVRRLQPSRASAPSAGTRWPSTSQVRAIAWQLRLLRKKNSLNVILLQYRTNSLKHNSILEFYLAQCPQGLLLASKFLLSPPSFGKF